MLTPSIPKIFAFCGAWKWKRSKTRETVRSTRNSSTWSFKATFWCKHYQLTQPVINIVLSCSNLGDAFSYLVTKNASWVAITYGIPNHAFHTFSFFFFWLAFLPDYYAQYSCLSYTSYAANSCMYMSSVQNMISAVEAVETHPCYPYAPITNRFFE